MVDKADIVVVSTAIAILTGVFSLIQTGFLDILNNFTLWSYYTPQAIFMYTAILLFFYILAGFAGYVYTPAEARKLGELTAGGLQRIATDFNKSVRDQNSPKNTWKAKVFATLEDSPHTAPPRPDLLALSLKIPVRAVHSVNAVVLAARQGQLGAPLEIAPRKGPSLSLLIPLTQFRRRIWGRVALVLIGVWAVVIYLIVRGYILL